MTMNPIEELLSHVQVTCPDSVANISPPLHADGVWTLDVDFGERSLTIDWSPKSGFGISDVSDESYGERHDETFTSLEKLKKRLLELLTTDARTTPPFGVLLSRLRENAGLTQQQLAAKLGVRQATLSGMEHRRDIQLSTLQRAVDVLGGHLEIYVVLTDGRYEITLPNGVVRHAHTMASCNRAARQLEPLMLKAEVFVALQDASALRWASEEAQRIRARGTVLEIPY
jgi:transcriptional regulator with XRE-family HTH domain